MPNVNTVKEFKLSSYLVTATYSSCPVPLPQHLPETSLQLENPHYPTEEAAPSTYKDIGELFATNTAQISVDALTNTQVYTLLFGHVSPPQTLPSKFSFGCN